MRFKSQHLSPTPVSLECVGVASPDAAFTCVLSKDGCCSRSRSRITSFRGICSVVPDLLGSNADRPFLGWTSSDGHIRRLRLIRAAMHEASMQLWTQSFPHPQSARSWHWMVHSFVCSFELCPSITCKATCLTWHLCRHCGAVVTMFDSVLHCTVSSTSSC